MSAGEYNVVENRTFCARKRVELRKYVRDLKVFPVPEPLHYFSTGILGHYAVQTNKSNGKTAILVVTDPFSKLTKPFLYVPHRLATLWRPSRNTTLFCMVTGTNCSAIMGNKSRGVLSHTFVACSVFYIFTLPPTTRKQIVTIYDSTVHSLLPSVTKWPIIHALGMKLRTRFPTNIIPNQIVAAGWSPF